MDRLNFIVKGEKSGYVIDLMTISLVKRIEKACQKLLLIIQEYKPSFISNM